jgi:WD40 repeat protein
VRNQEFKDFEATSLTHAGDELWVGDKKGMIHILNTGDLTQKTTVEKKHNHPITTMKTSRDGKLVASGDNYRYIYVFNAETKDEVGCFTYHTARIISLDFNHDSSALVTASLDLNVGVARLGDKTKKIIHRSNEKELTAAIFDDEGKFFTAGYDCSIRLWGL